MVGSLVFLTSLSIANDHSFNYLKPMSDSDISILHVKTSQLRWFGHLIWMPPVCLPLETCPAGKRPHGRPTNHWRDYTVHSIWTGKTLENSRMSLELLMGRRTSGILCLAWCHGDSVDSTTSTTGFLCCNHL